MFRGVAGAMRVVHGRNSVETNLQSKLTERNHKMDDLFEVVTLEMKQKVNKPGKIADGEVLDDKGKRTVLRTGVRIEQMDLEILTFLSGGLC